MSEGAAANLAQGGPVQGSPAQAGSAPDAAGAETEAEAARAERERRARKEVDEARDGMETWERRAVLAAEKGDAAMVDQARREAERKRREEERRRKLAERERMGRAMAKARSGGRDGRKRLGRESGILLERVKKLVDS